jgi:hypothetical protein
MQAPGDSTQQTDSTSLRGRRSGCAEDGIMLGTFLGVGVFGFAPFGSLLSLHAPPQPQLAFGAATYAVAIVAPLLIGVVTKLPVGLLRLFLSSAVFSLLLGPPLWGSFCIALALDQYAGSHMNAYAIALLGLLLYAILFTVIYFAFIRRTRVHS